MGGPQNEYNFQLPKTLSLDFLSLKQLKDKPLIHHEKYYKNIKSVLKFLIPSLSPTLYPNNKIMGLRSRLPPGVTIDLRVGRCHLFGSVILLFRN